MFYALCNRLQSSGSSITDRLLSYLQKEGLGNNSVVWDIRNAASGSLPGRGGIASSMVFGGGFQKKIGGVLVDSTAEIYADIPGLNAASALTVITASSRSHEAEADSGVNDLRLSFGSPSTTNRLSVFNSTGSFANEKVAIGHESGATVGRLGSSGATWMQGANTIEASQFSSAGTKMWIDGSPITLDQASAITTSSDTSPAATGYTDDNRLWLANRYGTTSTNGMHGLIRQVVVILGNITDSQHAAISAILKSEDTPEAKSLIMWGDSLTETKHLGYTNSSATIRITPPAVRYFAEYGIRADGQGVSGETAAQIATRATASSTYNNRIAVIWAGTNDEDNADEVGVVDEIASIVTHIGHARYVVVTPLVRTSWTTTQKDNIAAIRTEIISRFPNNYLDAWTMPNTTDGTPDTGYLRYQSPGVEDNLHPNDDWYDGYIAALLAFISGKGW